MVCQHNMIHNESNGHLIRSYNICDNSHGNIKTRIDIPKVGCESDIKVLKMPGNDHMKVLGRTRLCRYFMDGLVHMPV